METIIRVKRGSIDNFDPSILVYGEPALVIDTDREYLFVGIGDGRAVMLEHVKGIFSRATGLENIDNADIRVAIGSMVSSVLDNFSWILGSYNCKAETWCAGIISSIGVANNTNFAVAMGVADDYYAEPSDRNQTIRLEATTGTGRFANSITKRGFDYAEYFESESGEAFDNGTIVQISNDKIILANGEDFLGTISATASDIGNAADFHWTKRYLYDEFGESIMVKKTMMIDGEEREITVRKENPYYDPNYEYIPREERPEWNIVGLMGQVYVRMKEDVNPMEYVKAIDGFGIKSENKTRLRVMKTTVPFDIEKGYGVALCLLI